MNDLERLAEALASQAAREHVFAQLAVLAVGMTLAWFLARALRARVTEGSLRWKFGEGGFHRVIFPLAALALVWIGKVALRASMAVPILDVAVKLLIALAVIRFAVYVLRHILPSGAFLRGSERTIAWAMWGGVALHVTGLLPGIFDALDAVEFTLGRQKLSLLLVLQAVISVAVTLAISLWVARIVEGRVLANDRIEMSTRVVIAKLVRAVAFFAAILVALPVVGIDITALSVFGGALGVGLGFGLQKIASNYVSGFIILLDRSIRIGDLVTVEGRQGVVTEIASRYTVVRSLDGTEAIIPNEALITQTVINHSYSDRRTSVKVPMTVGYADDVDQVSEVLLRAARQNARVLAEPPPSVTIQKLGDNGIELELSVWIADPDQGVGALRGDLLKAALLGFREHGIQVPAPQREIRLITTPVTKENPFASGA